MPAGGSKGESGIGNCPGEGSLPGSLTGSGESVQTAPPPLLGVEASDAVPTDAAFWTPVAPARQSVTCSLWNFLR